MTQRSAAVLACAAAVAVLNTVDAARQARLGAAHAGTWVAAAATYLALGAALLIARWPERRRTALLMIAWLLAGVAIDAGPDWPYSRLAVTIGLLASALQPPLYAQMVLSYPAGRVRDRLERAFVASAYGFMLLAELPPLLFANFRCRGCSIHVPSLLFTGPALNLTVVGKVVSGLIIVLGLTFLGLIARRLRDSSLAARRTLLPLVLAAAFAAAEFIVLHGAELADWQQAFSVLNGIDLANLAVVPAAIFAGLATIRRDRGPLGDLVVELRAARPEQIESALARAVGDPSLELMLWLPEEQRFIDWDGAPVAVERDAPGRAVTLVGPEDEPVAAIVHDAGLVEQRALLEAAGSAASLAFQNAQLRAKLRALRELARGIHPAILTDGGLPAAVRSLVDRVPVPVTVDVPDGRYPEPVESAAYFVVSEALANVAKHAHARSAAISMVHDKRQLIAQVHDDGHGGADDQSGTGLRGLADRVGALNGSLTVTSAAGAGTTIRAEIPCGS